ncbi:MAG TPA: proton-conducting transporter membrane subunit [Candidatus Limnocylindrales bacterium]|nr:proton-conducting transporter membrane subunit [Candidatus Limnocylindrales bacterium]
MRLLLLLVIGGIGAAVAAWGLPRGGRSARIGAVVGVAALVAVTGDAFLLRPGRLTDTGQPITGLFDAHLVATVYLRLIVGLWGLMSLLLVFAAWLLGGLPRLRGLLPATLAAMTGGTVAMASADLTVGAAAAAVAGLASLLVILAAEGPAAVAAGARELRVTLGAGVVLLVALAIVPVAARLALLGAGVGTDETVAAAGGVGGPALGIVTLAVGLSVAARWGLLPFHVRVSRLTDLVRPETLPLLLAWAAVPFTVVAFAAVDRLISPLALPLDGERAVLIALALLTLVGASLAAFFHDDLRHAVGYLVIADAGLLLLAIAALDPEAWGPGRAWVVALAASKTALGLWAAVAEDRFGTRSIPDLRGWVRRSPLLGGGLALTALATFGIPGWVAFEARASLASLAADPPVDTILILAGFLALPTYVRLLAVGAGTVTSRVDGAIPERVFLRRRPAETLPVELEGAPSPAIETSTTTVAGVIAVHRTRSPQQGSAAAVAGSEAVRTTAALPADAVDAAGAPDDEPLPTIEEVRARRLARRGRSGPGVLPGASGPRASAAGASAVAAGARFAAALRRNQVELLSGTVLALAILAALTSYGALDLAGAAAEPAPILLGPNSD